MENISDKVHAMTRGEECLVCYDGMKVVFPIRLFISGSSGTPNFEYCDGAGGPPPIGSKQQARGYLERRNKISSESGIVQIRRTRALSVRNIYQQASGMVL